MGRIKKPELCTARFARPGPSLIQAGSSHSLSKLLLIFYHCFPEAITMKDFISKPSNFERVEFWAATTIFVFMVFFHITDAVTGDARIRTEEAGGNFNYFFISRLIRYTVLYGAFLLLNFTIVPQLVKKENLVRNVLLTFLVFIVVALIFGVRDTYLRHAIVGGYRPRNAVYNALFQKSFLYAAWLLLAFGIYSVIKYFSLFLLSRSEAIRARFPYVTSGGLAALVLWMLSLFFLMIGGAERPLVAGWAVVPPTGILLYWYAFHKLLPAALSRKHPFRTYLLYAFVLLLFSIIPVGLLGLLMMEDGDGGEAMAIATFNAAFHFFVTVPLTWILYKRHIAGNEEISHLKKELGQTHANFDFLRSQINPHFLFNALNTIYGTAIQEKADRTSEAVQKLGDMMRFMLQENMQAKISLTREMDYLNNYIAFQKLRTDPNPNIRIESCIDQQVRNIQIAPMLLIPFVENAFKHGISFREHSHIRISLEVKEKTVYFDVFNTRHARQENDPERDKSGIGLSNVKQRLKLLYPNRHDLVVRETGKDFFVHLTIQL